MRWGSRSRCALKRTRIQVDFKSASYKFGGSEKAFDGACQAALVNSSETAHLYDVILADEAQDFAPSFLKLCYSMLKPSKRLVYAYDVRIPTHRDRPFREGCDR